MTFKKLNTWSLIRLYNWVQNEWGDGTQIEENNIISIYDMTENFDWENEIVEDYRNNIHNFNNYDYIICNFEGFTLLTETEVRNICLSSLNSGDLSNGEFNEIYQEEKEIGAY